MNKGHERLTLMMSGMDALMALSEGNPGALTVLANLLKGTWHNVPGMMLLLHIDSLGIYGSRIWMLYKDVCRENMDELVKVLRGWQLGRLTAEQIHAAIDNPHRSPLPTIPSVEDMLAAI